MTKLIVATYKQVPRNRSHCSLRSYEAATRIYVSPDKETILEGFYERHRRPSKAYRAALLTRHPEFLGRVRWSQTAGCGCGCSPGFILDTTMRDKGRPVDLYLTVEAEK